jgi:hypothetical protein
MTHIRPPELMTLLLVVIFFVGHEVGGRTPLEIAQGLAAALSNFRDGGPGSPPASNTGKRLKGVKPKA